MEISVVPDPKAATSDNLLGHITRIPIFCTHPDKNAYCRKLRLFPPSPTAMLFAVTQLTNLAVDYVVVNQIVNVETKL